MHTGSPARTVVVLGSKPQAPLPAVAAPVVLTANNAVELGVPYREKYGSRIIAFVPAFELRRQEHIQQSFIKAKPDKIFLVGDDGTDPITFVKEALGLREADVSILSLQERNHLLQHALGGQFWPLTWQSIWVRGIGYVVHALLDLLGKREMEWLAQSTGLNAVFYAMKHFPDANIITAGIGLQPGEHFSGIGTFTNKTAKADQLTMKYWPPEKRPQVYTTDDAMHELGKVPKWEGEVFYFKN